MDETYLWYRDVPHVNPNSYATPQEYFLALKTSARTASGSLVDQFHWSQTTASWDAESAGESDDYGILWAARVSSPPREWVVAEVVPGSPAALAGIQRGARITSVDGVDFVNDRTSAGLDVLNEGIFPTVTQSHRLGFDFKPAIILTTAKYSFTTVQKVQAIATTQGNVGYLVFDAHLEKSEAELVAAINQLKASNVTDLVIDMRYNGGGLLYIASDLAYMVAGPAATAGKTFERLIYNDKLTAKNRSRAFETMDDNGQPLPHLDLRHVSILVTRDTASASESVINSLRGVDVTVDLFGSTTRGKPYGFVPQNNCGYTYFAIQFKGVNNKNFGDYTDGFAPTCSVTDDFTHQRGDVAEGLLRTALNYRLTGVCGSTSSPRAQVLASPGNTPFALVRSMSQEARILIDRTPP